ncbi:tRNA preQ1(34) S-adenosylmethionine ribosyltransferase-isomerase QueA [bacterium]|nr:MAG: tRNA preQ1(34) S-adenosylmethionine ribosyltransferase-isomerase QueA [bacterium]
MTIEQFDYHLPSSLIAQRPAERRPASRLLHLRRNEGDISHSSFTSFPDLLREGDLLVLNDAKVFPARLLARRDTGGAVEIFLLKFPVQGEDIPCLVRPGRRVRAEERVFLDDGATLIVRRVKGGFTVNGENIGLKEAVLKFGKVPLPPYIRREGNEPDNADTERYQTVYASHTGAVAAPTAGLHFDEAVLALIREKGVSIGKVTLHVGPGTFRPVRTRDITAHRMEAESYTVPPCTVDLMEDAKNSGGRVVAAGTTVVRTLESAFDGRGLRAGEGTSGLFIYPGYRFSVVDALLTNFHLPRSTLLMLVCAFAGTDFVMKAYAEAVKKGYRFYSYGDAMFIE